MRETGKHFDKTSISSRLRALILQLAVPLCLLSVFILLVFFDKTSISSRLRALILQLAVPLSLLSLFVVLVFLLSSLSLAQVSRNISTASRFNQNFKDEVDLKM